MERLKPVADVLQPDSRIAAFVRPDPRTGQFVALELEDCHRALAAIELHERVPATVRSYFETAKNVCLYGWFVYPFLAVSIFLSYTVVDMALRDRLGFDHPQRSPGLKELLKQAVALGLISDAGFASIKRSREHMDELEAEIGPISGGAQVDYTSILMDTLPYLRNSFAHPSMQTILTPGDAVSSLQIAAELIDQLFGR